MLFLDRGCRVVDRIELPVARGFDVFQNDLLRARDRRAHRCCVLARHRCHGRRRLMSQRCHDVSLHGRGRDASLDYRRLHLLGLSDAGRLRVT